LNDGPEYSLPKTFPGSRNCLIQKVNNNREEENKKGTFWEPGFAFPLWETPVFGKTGGKPRKIWEVWNRKFKK